MQPVARPNSDGTLFVIDGGTAALADSEFDCIRRFSARKRRSLDSDIWQNLDTFGSFGVDWDLGTIQLMEARLYIELKTSELAAMNCTDANLNRMRQAIKM